MVDPKKNKPKKKKKKKKGGVYDPSTWASRPDSAHLVQRSKFPDAGRVAALLPPAGKADVNAADEQGKTGLHWACVLGNVRVVEVLLAADGVEPDRVDAFGWTALHLAVANNHPDAVAALLETRCGVNAVTPDGCTALDLAVESDIQPVIDAIAAAGGLTNDDVLAKEEAAASAKQRRRRRK